MSLRRTVLRDDDGTVHTIPNSEIKLVSNMTRDCPRFFYGPPLPTPSQRAHHFPLQQVGDALAADSEYRSDFVSRSAGARHRPRGERRGRYLLAARTPRPPVRCQPGTAAANQDSFEQNQIRPVLRTRFVVETRTSIVQLRKPSRAWAVRRSAPNATPGKAFPAQSLSFSTLPSPKIPLRVAEYFFTTAPRHGGRHCLVNSSAALDERGAYGCPQRKLRKAGEFCHAERYLGKKEAVEKRK